MHAQAARRTGQGNNTLDNRTSSYNADQLTRVIGTNGLLLSHLRQFNQQPLSIGCPPLNSDFGSTLSSHWLTIVYSS